MTLHMMKTTPSVVISFILYILLPLQFSKQQVEAPYRKKVYSLDMIGWIGVSRSHCVSTMNGIRDIVRS